jgi:cellulose synthase (UDP-forming)
MNTPAITDLPPSFSGNTRSRLKKHTLLFRYLAEINLIFGAWYLQWRLGHSLNFNALWIAIPLLVAEIYCYIGGVLFTIGLWRPLVRQVKSFDRMKPPIPLSDYPAVDAFVTCYSEPIEMVEQTTRAALAMDYPATKLRVYILDDGNSPEMRSMAQRLCLEDLQSPILKAESQRLKAERAALLETLAHLRQMEPDAKTVEAFLANAIAETSITENQLNPPDKLLSSLRKFFLLLSPEHESVRDRLSAELQRLETAIYKKEIELSELARCRYIARPKLKGKAHHAKAGNINYAIFAGETTGTFILTLDADHLAKPQFLKRVLPYFYTYNPWAGKYESNQIALVQTPQDFYNIPPSDPFGHSAHLFYGPIQQGKDGLNAAFYTGTNAVLRREALVNVGLKYFSSAYAKDESRLDEFALIGGMSSSSITEDMNTAMRLHSSGWKSVYHHELLAEGLAPDDLSSTLKQRLRWAQGTIQVLRQENPLAKQGLNFWQRLQYFQTMYSYFSGFVTTIFLACPIVFFFTGVFPVEAYGSDFAIHFFPSFILNRITFAVAAWGISAREIWRSEQYAIALFPLFIQAVWSVFTKRSINFQVTPKQRQAGIYLNLVKPQIVVFGLTILGMLWSLLQYVLGNLQDPWAYVLNTAWAVYNLSLLGVIIRAAVWQPEPKTLNQTNVN